MIKLVTRIGTIMCVWVMLMVFVCNTANAWPISWLGKPDIIKTLTNDPSKVIDDSAIIGNPITAGSNTVVGKNPGFKGKIEWLFDVTNTSYTSVLSTTMQKIQNFTNWALGLLALICVIYLVYHGVMMLIKFDDDKAQSEALWSIKTVAWVLGGIWLSWMIVSFAFYIVSKLT